MDFTQFLNSDPETISRKLAAQVVVVERMSKTADLKDLVSAIKSHAMTGLKSGNPLYSGAVGAIGLGGLSAVNEATKRKEDRNWGNVATAAGLGGLGGAAVPALSGLGGLFPSHLTKGDSGKGLADYVSDGVKGTLSGAMDLAPVGTFTGAGAAYQGARGFVNRGNAALRSGETAAADAVLRQTHMPSGTRTPSPSATVENVVGGVKPEPVQKSLGALFDSGKGSYNPLTRLQGTMDRQIAARHGLPDVSAMQAMGAEVKPGQSPFAGNNRLRLLMGGSPTTAAPNTLYGSPQGHTSTRIPTPMIGGDQSRQFAQSFNRAAPAPTLKSTLVNNLPVLGGMAMDGYNWLRGR